MLSQPRSQCFFCNVERLIGDESRSIALRWERGAGNEADAHKDDGKTLSYQQCVNAFKSLRHL